MTMTFCDQKNTSWFSQCVHTPIASTNQHELVAPSPAAGHRVCSEDWMDFPAAVTFLTVFVLEITHCDYSRHTKLNHNLSRFNQVHTLKRHFYKVLFNIIIPCLSLPSIIPSTKTL
jgi:hypothetical protein